MSRDKPPQAVCRCWWWPCRWRWHQRQQHSAAATLATGATIRVHTVAIDWSQGPSGKITHTASAQTVDWLRQHPSNLDKSGARVSYESSECMKISAPLHGRHFERLHAMHVCCYRCIFARAVAAAAIAPIEHATIWTAGACRRRRWRATPASWGHKVRKRALAAQCKTIHRRANDEALK